MKFSTLIPYLAAVALSPLAIGTPALAQAKVVQEHTTSVQVTQVSDAPQAVVLSVRGSCEYSDDGKTFMKLNDGQVLTQGTVVRTGEGARTDLFFRRIGTTVRLQPGTEMKMEKMTRTVQGDKTVLETLLDLRTGRIFTVVRALVPDSTLEIRNAAGRSVVEGGGGKGRYIITADGTHVTDKKSVVPLKVIGETGVTVIAPGQKFNAKEGKVFALAAPEEVELLVDFDELDALAEKLAGPDELPKGK